MMSTSNTKSYGASNIPKKFQGSSSSSSVTTSTSNFSSPTRSSSPNQINNARWGPPLISINRGCVSASRFSIDNRNASNDRSIVSSSSRERINQSGINSNKALINEQKKTCMCSPTTHPGSFRCSLHRNVSARNSKNSNNDQVASSSSYQSHRLYARRSAMTNSIVRIGTVEGELVKRALASLIRPSSRQHRRRCDFQPRPSRLSVMSKAGD